MTPASAPVRRDLRQVLAYFGLTFVISWGGVLLVAAMPASSRVKAQDNPLFPLAVLAMVAGPSVSGVVVIILGDGWDGLRALGHRMLAWRADVSSYVVALLAAPAIASAVTLLLLVASPSFLPNLLTADSTVATLALGVVVALTAGFFEELGWTGCALPRLRRLCSPLTAGLLLGVLWSAWHVPAIAWGIGDRAGTVPLPVFLLVDGLAGLPAFRVLMVLVYDRTDSLLVSMLMHGSLTATVLILTPAVTGAALLTYGVSFAAGTWLVIGVLRRRAILCGGRNSAAQRAPA